MEFSFYYLRSFSYPLNHLSNENIELYAIFNFKEGYSSFIIFTK